jgi:hypothetical protein
MADVHADARPGCLLAHPGRTCARTAPGGYCAPRRCYCGACPWWVPIDQRATNTPDAYTSFDRAAILSSTGRRTNLAEYRHAQQSRPQR